MTQETLRNAIPELWVSASTAARILGRDRSTITRMVQRGTLHPVTHVNHGALRIPIFDRREVERLLEGKR